MKKVLCLLVTAAILASFAACGSSSSSEEDELEAWRNEITQEMEAMQEQEYEPSPVPEPEPEPEPIPLEGLQFAASTYALMVGEELILDDQLILQPEDADTQIKWEISNTAIATISDKGFLTTQGGGTIVVTATAKEENLVAECEITIEHPVYSKDNLPDGLFIMDGDDFHFMLPDVESDLFYRYKNSAIYDGCYDLYMLMDYDNRDVEWWDIHPVVERGSTLAIRGNVNENTQFAYIDLNQEGRVALNAYITSDRTDRIKSLDLRVSESAGPEVPFDITFVNGVEMNPTTYFKERGFSSFEGNITYKGIMCGGDMQPHEVITLGGFSGSDYYEEEVVADLWVIQGYSDHIRLPIETTTEGYFLIHIPEDWAPGLYMYPYSGIGNICFQVV